jgi:hypothetical protein
MAMHLALEAACNYPLLGAALLPVFMYLDSHTFKYVIETVDELMTLFFCWVMLWPFIGFFVLRIRFNSHR